MSEYSYRTITVIWPQAVESPRVLGQDLAFGLETCVRVPILRRELHIHIVCQIRKSHRTMSSSFLFCWEILPTHEQASVRLGAARVRNIRLRAGRTRPDRVSYDGFCISICCDRSIRRYGGQAYTVGKCGSMCSRHIDSGHRCWRQPHRRRRR